MLKVLLLPGNGIHNKAWIERVQSDIGGDILSYAHWQSGEKLIDFDVEGERLKEMAEMQSVFVFAKSAGAVLAMKTVRELGLRVEKAVFVGMPVSWGMERGLPVDVWLQEWSVPTLFIQKEHDPAFSASALAEFLSGEHELLILKGEDHEYAELEWFIPRVEQVFE